MLRLDRVPPDETSSVLNDLAKGDIDVFCRLQPRLYRVLPFEQRAKERHVIVLAGHESSDMQFYLQLAAQAASRGLALVPQADSSSSSSLSAYRQGFLCIARCCEAVATMMHVCYTEESDDRRAQVEVAVALQSAGERQAQLQQHEAVMGSSCCRCIFITLY